MNLFSKSLKKLQTLLSNGAEAVFPLEYQEIIDAIPEMVFFKSMDGRYLGCNRACEEFTGHHRSELVGKRDQDIFPSDLVKLFHEHDRHVAETGNNITVEQRLRSESHPDMLVEMTKSPIFDEHKHIIGVLGIARDIRAKRLAEEKIRHLAYYDALTGLLNRAGLLEQLQPVIEACGRGEMNAVILMLDVDKFKTVNNIFGHEMGDKLLKTLAERLQNGAGDDAIAARIGADEFVLILTLPELEDVQAMLSFAAQIQQLKNELEAVFNVAGCRLTPSCSVGVVPIKVGSTEENLFRQLDMAMFAAKKDGVGDVRWFEDAMLEQVEHRYLIETQLHHALQHNQLRIYLQPQKHHTVEESRYEVLIRWQHPTRGLIGPGAFIQIAEETGLIQEVGKWVLEESLKLIQKHSELYLSVNVSVNQFNHPDFVGHVEDCLDTYEVEGRYLTLELTENLMVGDYESIAAKLRRLHDLGVGISIDDFGTGYSSMMYLKRLPFSELKIDQGFVRGLPHDSNDASLVLMMLSIARHLDMRVVAEGVETQEQADFLLEHGCDYLQGYLLGYPAPPANYL